MARSLHEWPLLRGLATRVAHLAGAPSLHDLFVHGQPLTASATDAALTVTGADSRDLKQYVAEQPRVTTTLRDVPKRYPDYFAVEDGTAEFLYVVVRSLEPVQALELGVADGYSTRVILNALDANQTGRLDSVDVDRHVGGAAVGHPRWSLHIHTPSDRRRFQLRQLLTTLPPIDLVFHDAVHTYHDQFADYTTIWPRIRPGGLLVSDDVDQSWAFIDFARSRSLSPILLVDHRKVTGALVKLGP